MKIKNYNVELSYKNKLRQEVEFYLKNNKSFEGKEDYDKMVAKVAQLKTKYANFTKDRTRVASMRIMAAEFLTELENLLK